ncbi:hypothetical protein PsorP6_016702 [Peronosclerospora sorghi]|uniref:Uncharacterized protein n=1 Tax=Peronosclerospora sorghi TaxID=230839 RepID=A0ACC0WC69_9STRA|nr:hypothetical protein PsorP6_016702 [Peronosclerospora sorghi]
MTTIIFRFHISMPPLVVIRSSCQHIEYLENQNAWQRSPQLTMDDNNEHMDEEDGEELLPQAEEVLVSSSCGFSKAFGFSREGFEVKGMQAFRCAECGNVVADHDDIVSKSFHGRTGKAFLLNNMYNVHVGYARNRNLITGIHCIADILCNKCDFVLGWKYLKAMESSQKYKEGKFILEHAVVQDDSEELAWKRCRAL